MQIDIKSKYGILFVRLFGELTYKTRKKLNDEVLNLLEEIGIKNVIFNLENVYRLDESGFKTLIKCYKVCSKNHGNSIICLNKNKFNFNFDKFSTVTDELTAVKKINI